jgi:aspartokinase-like uncharacterized kinase
MKKLYCKDNSCKSNNFVCIDDVEAIINKLSIGSISNMISATDLKKKLRGLIK